MRVRFWLATSLLLAGVRPVLAAEPATATAPPPLTPAESLRRFHVAADLELELVLSEPEITQPLFLNFDERGRLWVVEFRQYPKPAGLTPVSHDQFWRAVYDKVPPPPPHHDRGLDRITIHEDSDGDGSFDRHKTFVDGLNIVTAVERGRGGVWILNPPYLLFYPDEDHDDVPDGDPVVHLAGFGLEDTHSVVNSLRWGPDGWLYGAQGSTVTGHMKRPGLDREPFLHTMGQGIWRYHPETRRFEFFAEGGGNTFGVEIDAKGRIFSGHNGGDTRGFHYVQGGYLRKGFEKHGPLSNPYAFGYFEPMSHHKVERFTHNFIIYDGGALPPNYVGRLFGVEPLQGRIVLSEITPERSSFKTKDITRPVTSEDPWFRPVDIKAGPDGAVYFCDWSDNQIAHFRAADGAMETAHGRIYRLKAKGAKPAEKFDLAAKSSRELAALAGHPNKWFRQTALRLLVDRRDAAVIPFLAEQLFSAMGQVALEALWGLALSGGLDEAVALRALAHEDTFVRLWTVRLLCDEGRVSPAIAERLAARARDEPELEGRSQLAASARRLPAHDCLAIVRELLLHSEDASDPRQPLMIWWAIEAKMGEDRDQVLALFSDSPLWDRALVREHLLGRVMRRLAQSGTRPELLAGAKLFQLAPTIEHSQRLMEGFEAAFKGRSLKGLPEELLRAIARHRVGSPSLNVRLGERGAAEHALALIGDEQAPMSTRLECIEVAGEIEMPGAVPVLLELVERAGKDELRQGALTALQRYSAPEIGSRVLAVYHQLRTSSLAAAQTLLASRPGWAKQFVQAIEADVIARDSVPLAIVRQLTHHHDPTLAGAVAMLWPTNKVPTTGQMEQTIQRFAGTIRSGSGDPFRGRDLFQASCSACHQLFGEGGRIGPDLTTFRRDDIDTMLLHIVNPNAEIREGYENFSIETKDGRTLSGFLVERDEKMITLRGLDDQNITLARADIASLEPAGMSIMPDSLLDNLDERQLCDLFAYLRSTQPLVPKPKEN